MKKVFLFIFLILNFCSISARQTAFPGAGGFGKYAIGGRQGKTFHVTNLNDSGTGSFRDAVSQPQRTVVFDVSGVIKINSRLTVESYITIDGATAPKDGITVYGNGVSFSGSHDVIIRNIRFRGSVEMGRGVCTVAADNTSDIIFDHVSIEWGRWDNLHIKDSRNITLQYCLIGEGINPQMFGALLENPVNLTIDHCLWVDNQSRNPKAKAGMEIINNVIYNWKTNGLVGGHSSKDHFQDVINNYFIAGPSSGKDFIGMFTKTDHVYQKGNMVDLNKNGKLDGRLVTADDFSKIGATLESKPNNNSLSVSKIEKPEDAFNNVLDHAGAYLNRDETDKRLIGYVRSLGKEGMIVWAETDSSELPVMQTGGQIMPMEWIDKDTNHKVIRLTKREGNSASFYFHNNPFISAQGNEGDRMVFYGNDKHQSDGVGMQLFTVNLSNLEIIQLTEKSFRKNGEIVGRKNHNVYYQINDSVYSINIDNSHISLIYIFPSDFKGSVTTLNADETQLGGVCSTEAEKEIFKANPAKHDYFNMIYEAKLPRTLFTIDIQTGKLTKLFTDSAWLNHVQFSPTDPKLMMFCHEGPWHKVDRIWTIDTDTKQTKLMHSRTMDMEIAGHEWFSPDGKIIWYDLQQPRGKIFFVSGTEINTGKEVKYQLERNQWSVHYTISPDQKLFAGDGGDTSSVANAKDGKWINLFKPKDGHFDFERLVNMKYHQYSLEPNVHFSPGGKWIIFRANFEGFESVYAVKI
jgi:oligogalacturonide lyase